MPDQPGFVVYFLSADIQDLINKGATDIKISGTMKNGKLEVHAEGENTNNKAEEQPADSTSRSAGLLNKDVKLPCPMPCSTWEN